MSAFRFSARPGGGRRPERERRSDEIIRRFFHLIERLDRPKREVGRPAPEVKARISRLDETPPRTLRDTE